jgi:hypothetical protein
MPVGPCFALFLIRKRVEGLSEAEVHYGNRKRIFLLRAADVVNRRSECTADEIAASARSSFARLASAKNAVVLQLRFALE